MPALQPLDKVVSGVISASLESMVSVAQNPKGTVFREDTLRVRDDTSPSTAAEQLVRTMMTENARPYAI